MTSSSSPTVKAPVPVSTRKTSGYGWECSDGPCPRNSVTNTDNATSSPPSNSTALGLRRRLSIGITVAMAGRYRAPLDSVPEW
jgi:hypothetical protein